METNAGHRYHVIENAMPYLDDLRRAINAIEPERWDRYDNPFEAKLTLRDKQAPPFAVDTAFCHLESRAFVAEVSAMFGVELVADRWRHYAGVFRYLPGDHLGVHVDAGIHPASGLRKHVTAVLYFGQGYGALELWSGTSCATDWETRRHYPSTDDVPGPGDDQPGHLHMPGDPRHSHPWVKEEEPQLRDLVDTIQPGLGTLVLFENNDYAWHGTARNESDDDRIVLTVSYLSGQVDAFANRRQRAFFVPRPDEEWSGETFRLRDLRADPERYAEAYRA